MYTRIASKILRDKQKRTIEKSLKLHHADGQWDSGIEGH